jgi:CheY-like chemotaxis protein
MNRRTILIIEDREDEREILSRYLEFVGAGVLQASSGDEGILAAENEVVDLILLDLSLPALDGWQVMERLQQRPATAMIPVVALTAQPLEWEELEAAGFCGCLEKPLNPYVVAEEVERCIGRLDTPWTEPEIAGGAARPRSPQPRSGAGAPPVAPAAQRRPKRRSVATS